MSTSWSSQHEKIKALYHEFFGSWANQIIEYFGFDTECALLDSGHGVIMGGPDNPVKVSETSSFFSIKLKHYRKYNEDLVVMEIYSGPTGPEDLGCGSRFEFDPDVPEGVLLEKSLHVIDTLIRLQDLRVAQNHTIENTIPILQNSPLDYVTTSTWKRFDEEGNTYCLFFHASDDPVIRYATVDFYTPFPVTDEKLEEVMGSSDLRWNKD